MVMISWHILKDFCCKIIQPLNKNVDLSDEILCDQSVQGGETLLTVVFYIFI